MENKTKFRILKILLKDILIKPTITSLAGEVGMSRVGVWKVLKKIAKEKLILISSVGTGKTNVQTITLNWSNPLTEKNLVLALIEDAQKSQRWINNFAELEDKVNFLIIYGSIINHFKEADDIDILGVTNKNNFTEIDESVKRTQKTQLKKIHALNFTQTEFKQELKKPNKAFIDAVKKGIVLFGQEKFIKFIRNLKNERSKRLF